MIKYVVLALLLALAVAMVYVLVVERPRADRRNRRVEGTLAKVKDLAWSQREVDPELAGLVIAAIRAIEERGPAVSTDLDDLLELAYTHRETSAFLSPSLIDLIRGEQRELGG